MRLSVGKLFLSRVNVGSTLDLISSSIENNNYGYVCVTNSRTAYLANKDNEYCRIQNESLLSVPDGAPLVWIAHNNGCDEVGKVSGKDLMDAIFNISYENSYSHFFYGCSQNTIELVQSRLKEIYPKIDIKGAVSPPFQPIEEFNIDSLAKEINHLKPTFFWCGLGAPKQEKLMALLQPKLDETICVGVGLAFEYIAGTVNRAPLWMQKSGLEWCYRLAQQPRNISRAIIPLSWIFTRLVRSFIVK